LQQEAKYINNLIDRCINNEQAAYYQLYQDYHRAMYNTAFRILHDRIEAEDCMQESFIKAFQKLKTFRKESRYKKEIIPFASWLKRIVINNSINQLRKNNKYQFTELKVFESKIDEEQNDCSLKDEKAALVLENIKELKPNYRLIITLYLIEGYDYEEISEIMQISNQNSRTLLSRAKKSLRKRLKNTA
jgi:RNA polymerase sigma-70 factor (ECF subfamily)